ncbi:MAG: hypothetical protein GXP63_07715, partial [DPANN group archaeon]|nr:hypothetical protein [DPANN group archaeon]
VEEQDSEGKTTSRVTYDNNDRKVAEDFLDDEGNTRYTLTYDKNGKVKKRTITVNGQPYDVKQDDDPEDICKKAEDKTAACREQVEDAQRSAELIDKGLPDNWLGGLLNPVLTAANVYNKYVTDVYQSALAGTWAWNMIGNIFGSQGGSQHHMLPGVEEWLDKQIWGGEYQAENYCRDQFQDIRVNPNLNAGEYAAGQMQGKVRRIDKNGNDIMALIITGERSSLIEYPNATVPDKTIREYFYKMEWKVIAAGGDLAYQVRLIGVDTATNRQRIKNDALKKTYTLASGKRDQFMGKDAFVDYSRIRWDQFCLVFSKSSAEFRDAIGGKSICTDFVTSNAGVESFDFGSSTPGWMLLVPNAEGEGMPATTENDDNGQNTPAGNDEETAPDSNWAD